MLPNKYSFRFLSRKKLKDDHFYKNDGLSSDKKKTSPAIVLSKSEKNTIDDNKRSFLKLAGIAGLGVVASQVLPNKASAYVMGGTPTSNVVGLKDHENNRIDPTKEEQLPAALTASGNLKVALLEGSLDNVGLKNVASTPINPATEDTLALIKNTDGIKKITDPLPAGTNTIGGVNLMDTIVLLKSLLNVIANPSYVDKSANQMRAQVTGTISTVTTVTTVTNLTNFGTQGADVLYRVNSVNAWANNTRRTIS